MKALTAALVLLTACIVSTSANAGQFKNGNKLLEECSSPAHSRNIALCLAYIQGMADAAAISASLSGRAACIPPGVHASQVKDVVVQYLMKNPSERHYSGGYLAIAAIGEAWCPLLEANTPAVKFKSQRPRSTQSASPAGD
jgi:hypothetical protein